MIQMMNNMNKAAQEETNLTVISAKMTHTQEGEEEKKVLKRIEPKIRIETIIIHKNQIVSQKSKRVANLKICNKNK